MKKYIVPEIEISRFCVEDVITESAALTAEAQVKDVLNDKGSVANYTMIWK